MLNKSLTNSVAFRRVIEQLWASEEVDLMDTEHHLVLSDSATHKVGVTVHEPTYFCSQLKKHMQHLDKQN